MSKQPTMQIESRTQHGSGVANRMRRQGRIPGVLYGQGNSLSISIEVMEFRNTVSASHYGSQIVQLILDGEDAGTALVKAVQVNTLIKQVMNVDLQRVSQQDRVSISVPIVLEGEPAAVRAGGVLEQLVHVLNIRCRVSDVPSQISYNVSAMQIGDAVHAGQLALPQECELLDKPDEAVAVVVAPTVPLAEEAVEVKPGVSGPELTGEKQKEDFPPER